MLNLPLNLILVKNLLSSPDPWLVTLDVTLPDASMLYLVRNTEDILFQGQTYLRFPFDLAVTEQSSQGEIPTLKLKVANVLKTLQPWLEEYEGMVDCAVVARWINAAHLTENYADLELSLQVLSADSDDEWIAFTLGAPNPLRSNFPRDRYLAGQCRYVRWFKGAECKYSGAETTCDGTLDTCRSYGNSINYGGCPGLQGGGIRFA